MSAALQFELHGPPNLEPTPASITTSMQRDKRSHVGRLIDSFGSLSSLLRQVGVAAVVVSMCLFLFDGLTTVNDTMRFYSMLMMTGMLSAGGIALAFVLKEQRGARSFFGLALLSVPVNFAVLGAFFYSVFQFDSSLSVYPSLVEWKITDIKTLGNTMLIAFAALIPVTVFSVSVMARRERVWLSAALLISSSLMLIPVRDATWIASIVALAVFLLIVIIKRQGENAVTLKTLEGGVVQALLFLPPAIMLVRSFWLYGVTALSGAVVSLTVFVCLRYMSKRFGPGSKVTNVFNLISSLAAFVAGVYVMAAVTPIIGAKFAIVLFCVVFGVLMFELENRVLSADLAEIMGISAALIIAMAVVYHQLVYSGLLVLAIGVVLVGVMLSIAALQQSKEKVAIASVTLLAVLLLNGSMLSSYFFEASWLGFASLGAAAILTASMLDRFGPLTSLKFQRYLSAPK